jgi:hypothetical protein
MSNDIRLINLSSYVRPKVEENKSKNWVLNGKNNSFYQYIIDRFNGSPTNSAIISSYVDLIYGNGIKAKNKNTSNWVNFVSVLSNNELRKIISDFELFGEASFQVIKTKDKKDLSQIYHIPKQLVVPALENEDGEIEGYWYCKDWSNINKYKPEYFSAFGTSKDEIEIYCIKPYKAGKNYFSDPDYIAALPYAEMEEELANYYINSIKKGLSAGYIINVPMGLTYTPEQKDEFERKIKAKLTGSPNALSFVISFNGAEQEITVTPFPVNERQHQQWEYLTNESRQQIMTGHKVVSPKLFGIMADGGLGNNANELDEAEAQLMKRVIQPKQRYILEAIEDVLVFYNMNLDLYFKPLTETSTVTKMSEHKHDEDFSELEKYAETIDDEWEQYDASNIELSAIEKSEQDTALWKIRYKYNIGTSKTPKGESRSFCNKMMSLSDGGKVFRKEDIEAMSKSGVNGQFAHSGGQYDIFLYAGGVNCYHRWERVIFKKKRQADGTPYIGNALQNTFEVNVSEARRQGLKLPINDKDVAIAEIDKPNRGSLK